MISFVFIFICDSAFSDYKSLYRIEKDILYEKGAFIETPPRLLMARAFHAASWAATGAGTSSIFLFLNHAHNNYAHYNK